MTADPRKGFPVILTLFAAIAFAILCGLGTWQYQRMQWKRDVLARIEAARTAAPVPIAEALRRARAGQDVEWMRVEADCAPPRQSDRQGLLYGLNGGQIAWRALAVCRLADGPYEAIVVDRGLSTRDAAALEPAAVAYPAPRRVKGVLRSPDPAPNAFVPDPTPREIAGGLRFDNRRALSVLVASDDGVRRDPAVHLVAESEFPAPEGITPAALPTNISNRHLEYVITWFGLAGALAAVYGAMLWRRLKP